MSSIDQKPDKHRGEVVLEIEDSSTVLQPLARFDVESSDMKIAESLRALSEREVDMREQYEHISNCLKEWISESFEMERQRALTR